MIFKIKDIEINIDLLFIINCMLVLVPSVRDYYKNYYTCYLFITFHELSHIFVASIFGINTKKINIGICGLNIIIDKTKSRIGNIKRLIIYLAGPISNLILALCISNVNIIFYTNILLFVINLIPIYPLDGFNVLDIMLKIYRVSKSEVKLAIVNKIFLIFLAILGIIQLLLFKNPSIILMYVYIYIQSQKIDKSSMYQKYYKNVTNF